MCAMSENVAVCGRANKYESSWGTSLAAPQVAGVVALMRSINSSLSPAEIENIIKSTADPIADAHLYLGQLGTGRVNAYKAVQAACLTTNFTNQTVATNQTITDCNIDVQNVKVQNNAKLTLAAKYLTTINGAFEVTLGSQLEVGTGVVVNGKIIYIGSGGTIGIDDTEDDIESTPEGTWMLNKMEGEFIWNPEVWSDYFENNIPVNEWFTLTINGNQLSGKSGCSGFQGNLASTSGSLVFSNVLGNLVGCFPQIQNLEHLYVDFVRRANYMYVSGDNMYLFIGNEPVLEFYRQ